jgi:hypothetical protein
MVSIVAGFKGEDRPDGCIMEGVRQLQTFREWYNIVESNVWKGQGYRQMYTNEAERILENQSNWNSVGAIG